jgi:REP element-mobilizing transposase RayT
LFFLVQINDFSLDEPAKFIQESHKRFGNIFTANFGLLKVHFVFGCQAHQKFFAAKENEMTIAAAQRFVQTITGLSFLLSDFQKCFKFKIVSLDCKFMFVIGSASCSPSIPTHKYVANGFLRQERLQMYINWCTEEARKCFQNWSSRDSIDLFKGQFNCIRTNTHKFQILLLLRLRLLCIFVLLQKFTLYRSFTTCDVL